jgi:hypothetical protein
MPPIGVTHFAIPEAGGLKRDPATIFSHRMPGASDEKLLQNAVSMTLEVERQGEQILVTVSITNDQTGHHVPTDSPLRHLILLVNVFGPEGEVLTQIDGPTVPDWGGIGNPDDGYYAGLPGKAFAKVLMELWIEVSPTGAYWNPTRVVSDNRLGAFETDTSNYTFAAQSTGNITVEARLLFRRAYIELMDQKGWDALDILMEEAIQRIP